MKTCGLCKAQKEAYRLVAENKGAFAIIPYNPLSPAHVLVLPKKHVKDLADLTAVDSLALHKLISDIRKTLYKKYPQTPPVCSIQMGKLSSIKNHLHYHVVSSDSDIRRMWVSAHAKGENKLKVKRKVVLETKLRPEFTKEKLEKYAKAIKG